MTGEERAILMEITGKIGKLESAQEANLRVVGELTTSVNRLVDKLEQSDDIAREADQRAKAAHHRLDELRNQELPEIRDSMKEMRTHQRWLIGTTISVIALFLTAIGILLNH